MNKKCNLLINLFITLFLISSITSICRIPAIARATYVEGIITQDTYWTLVDSPFIVSRNITINPGVTLMIEPGVQVRFGQSFCIIVNGALIAQGTDDKMIRFTSNNGNASTGDWGTILINSPQQSSITHCIIEYGTNGIALEAGYLNLQNDVVRFNSNGFTADGGSATIMNNEMIVNTMSGISLAGANQITIQNNNISSNRDGIVLTGDLTGSISIKQNDILNNGQAGILLDADAYYNTAIFQNNVSSNTNGFLVETNASTYLTRNYISNNTYGILYESGAGHEAHFNDIYNNTVGMDVSPGAGVNAIYNYWGDQTGPFHSSLNPNGRGNPVGGDGVNLDFIFFLSKPIDYANQAPTAVLLTDKRLVALGQNVTFIGTNSYDDGRVDQYFYDFGDGYNSGWTTLSLFNHTYSRVGIYAATLTVMDDFGMVSQNPTTTYVTVAQNLTPLSVSMNLSSEVADYNGNITVAVYVSTESGALENAAVTLLSFKGGSFSPASGVTDSTGQFETTFTAPKVEGTTYVRLIAMAAETGYADGSCHEYLKVLPLLHIQMTVTTMVKSEATVDLVFHVTDGMGQSVSDASLAAAADNGTLLTSTGLTDSDGNVTLSFTAPYTLDPSNVTITVSAQKPGFTDGHDEETVSVLQNTLAVNVTADNTSIVSEGNTGVTTLVSCDAQPVPNATVTMQSGSMGNFTPTSATTDSYGMARFSFTALQTTSAVNATITATATKSHYVDGRDQTTLSIEPRVLIAYLTAQNYSTISESEVALTVHVTYNLSPVSDVSLTVASMGGGSFSQLTGTTDAQGYATFNFTAPQVNQPLDITITVEASKTGYANGYDSLMLRVNPGNISVQVTCSSYAITTGSSIVVTVNATADSNAVADAQVVISADAGNFSLTTGVTDSTGTCSFLFNAPPTIAQLPVVIVANVMKNGYIGNASQTTINILPATMHKNEGGLPLTIILVIIPVIIAAIVIVLIKLKIIVISAREEEAAANAVS